MKRFVFFFLALFPFLTANAQGVIVVADSVARPSRTNQRVLFQKPNGLLYVMPKIGAPQQVGGAGNVQSVAGKTGAVTLTPSDVAGLPDSLTAKLNILKSASEFSTSRAAIVRWDGSDWVRRIGTAPTTGMGGVFRAGPAGTYYERNWSNFVEAKWFLDFASGATTQRMQAAINFYETTKAKLLLPPDTIRISGKLTLTKTPRIVGAGNSRTVIVNESTNPNDHTFSLVGAVGNYYTWGCFEGFTIHGNRTNGDGIHLEHCGRITFRDINVRWQGGYGIYYFAGWTPHFEHVRSEENMKTGCHLEGLSASDQINGALFISGSYSRNKWHGIYVDNGVPATNAATLVGTTCSGNDSTGVYFVKGSTMTLIDPFLEYNGKHAFHAKPITPFAIRSFNILGGNFLNKSTGTYDFIRVENVPSAQISNIAVTTASATNLFIVNASGTMEGLELKNIQRTVAGTGALVDFNQFGTTNLRYGGVLFNKRQEIHTYDNFYRAKIGAGDAWDRQFIDMYSTDPNSGLSQEINFGRAMGTLTGKTALGTGITQLGRITASAFDGTRDTVSVAIQLRAEGPQTATSHPSSIAFQTTPVGSISPLTAFQATNDQFLLINQPSRGLRMRSQNSTSYDVTITNAGELNVFGVPRTRTGTTAPNLTPSYLGQWWLNTATKIPYVATGTAASSDFTQLPPITLSTSAPLTTPAGNGLFFLDLTNKKLYISTGTSSSADWTILN